MNKKIFISLFISTALMLTACEKQGPAETMGEKIDDKVNQVEDTLKDRGPMQKAGDRIDDAVKN